MAMYNMLAPGLYKVLWSWVLTRLEQYTYTLLHIILYIMLRITNKKQGCIMLITVCLHLHSEGNSWIHFIVYSQPTLFPTPKYACNILLSIPLSMYPSYHQINFHVHPWACTHVWSQLDSILISLSAYLYTHRNTHHIKLRTTPHTIWTTPPTIPTGTLQNFI